MIRGDIFIKDSVALVHQVVTVDKFRLEQKLATLPRSALNKIDKAIDYVLKD